jgi:hypothetical protein
MFLPSIRGTGWPSLFRPLGSCSVVRIEAPEPIQFLANCMVNEVFGIDVFRSKNWLHGVNELRGFIVSPFCQIRDIEGNHHATCF